MQGIIASLIVGGAIWWIVVENIQTAGPDDLRIEVGKLRSYVSEAERMTEQVQSGSLTANFFQVEIEMLRAKTDGVLTSIDSLRPPSALSEKFVESHQLGERSRDELVKLACFYDQPQRMGEEKARLDEIFHQILAVEKSLQ